MGQAPSPSDRRFDIIRLLGRGGMGVVYEVHDRNRGTRVALKRLVDASAAGIYRFKNEFRSLADLSHPNLVSLYELFHERGQWFFTMELVPGVNLLEYVRPGSVEGPADENEETQPLSTYQPRPAARNFPKLSRMPDPLREDRLRLALQQMVEGLMALHAAGKLHCDIKPSNIRVTPDGRLVLLDFGLVTSIAEQFDEEDARAVAGTVSYMSPEQLTGRLLTEATDWYSIGVVLYRALAGSLPQVQGRGDRAPVPPSALSPGISSDLERLALDLLDCSAERRPRGPEILRRLSPMPYAANAWTAAPAFPFVGREAQLRTMQEAVREIRDAGPGVVFVRGQPGSGKTHLLARFGELFAHDRNVLVLKGRCREQESLPFKAIDSLADGLAEFLRRHAAASPLQCVPRDADALCRVFEVFRTVPAFVHVAGRRAVGDDQQHARRWASAALRELLLRISDQYCPILIIDDAQWGDADSANLLIEILTPPDPPPILLVCAHRLPFDSADSFPALLRESQALQYLRRWDIEVGALTEEESIRVAEAVLMAPNPRLAGLLARESGGNAYFLHELATRASERGEITAASLDALLLEKMSGMPPGGRKLLEVVAVCGQPLRQDDAYRIAGLNQMNPALVSALRAARLVSCTGFGAADTVEPYHDRVRETVLSGLPAEARRNCHLQVARTLQENGRADSEMLAVHFEAGGENETAGQHYIVAGRRAAAVAAFDHAAALFSRALALGDLRPEERQALRVQLADALANAGRSVEAARVYRQASSHAPAHAQIDLARKAAYHYSISGHGEDAAGEFRKVLRHAGLFFPASNPAAVICLLGTRAAIRLRGLHFHTRGEDDVPARLLEQMDAAQAAVAGFGLIDLIRAVYFNSRFLLLALRAGEPGRLIHALAFEASAHAVWSARGEQRAEPMLAVCRDLVARYPSRRSRGVLAMAEGLVTFATGQWRRAIENFQSAEATLSEHCTGVNWELASCRYALALSQINAGRYGDVARRIPELLRQAEDRGDLFSLNSFQAYAVPLIRLASDMPDAAERMVEQVEKWHSGRMYLQHLVGFMSRVMIHLYRSERREAWSFAERYWTRLGRRLFLYGSNTQAYCRFTRIGAALAAASMARSPEDILDKARSDRRALVRLHPRFVRPMVLAVDAGLASFERPGLAAEQFAGAAEEFDKLEMTALAAACRIRAGALTSGDRGVRMVESAETVLRQAGVRNPPRFAAALVSSAEPRR